MFTKHRAKGEILIKEIEKEDLIGYNNILKDIYYNDKKLIVFGGDSKNIQVGDVIVLNGVDSNKATYMERERYERLYVKLEE